MPSKKKTTKKTTHKTAKKSVATKTASRKKTAVKRPSKKVATKRTKRQRESRPLIHASESERFWTTDGQILDSLVALNEALNNMSEAVFVYHARGEQNDFAEWVQHVLCDADCADALRRSRKAKTAQTVIRKQLKYYDL